MSREEVRRVDPRLVGNYPRGSAELIGGIKMRAMVYFIDGLASSVLMRGNDSMAKTIETLTQYYGLPDRVDNAVRYIDVPGGITGGGVTARMRAMAWCNGSRLITVSGEDYNYHVSIMAADHVLD